MGSPVARARLFPAHAGMNRISLDAFPSEGPSEAVPRTRGDEPPQDPGSCHGTGLFPAHAGMNRVEDAPARFIGILFPAHAGMNRPGG